MAGLSPRFQNLTKKLVNKYGTTVTYKRETPGTFDPATQTETGEVETTASLKVVIEDYRAHEVAGPIRYGDKKVIVSDSDINIFTEPQADDIIVLDGTSYRVVHVQGYSAGDDVVGYSLQVRR